MSVTDNGQRAGSLGAAPEIGREELARFFKLTPAELAFVGSRRGRGPPDRLGLQVRCGFGLTGTVCYLNHMTNLVGRPISARGQRRREQLVEAGVVLLAEAGWPAVTTRAVAGRAGANVALIHYHFGGLPGLHAAIASRAAGEVLTPIVDVLVAAGPADAVETLRRLLPATTGNDRVLRLVAELVAGAGRDPALGEALRDALRTARVRLAERLGELYPNWPHGRRIGAATVALALLDGLMLHYLLDGELPAGEALAALDALIAGTS